MCPKIIFLVAKKCGILRMPKNKNMNVRKKIKETKTQCSLCVAQFEVWLNNLRINEERKEKIQQHFLGYCPVCARFDEKN